MREYTARMIMGSQGPQKERADRVAVLPFFCAGKFFGRLQSKYDRVQMYDEWRNNDPYCLHVYLGQNFWLFQFKIVYSVPRLNER